MALFTKTLLQVVNDVAREARIIQGEQGAFTALTSNSLQLEIDTIVRGINQVIQYIFDNDDLQPRTEAEGTITLVDGQREYAFPSDYEAMLSEVLHDLTNGYQIYQYEKGFEHLRNRQLQPANYIGRPFFWVINPTNGNIYFDHIPSASDAGQVYNYLYHKSLVLSDASHTFPFSDEVVEVLIPAFKEYWSSGAKEEFNASFFTASAVRAVDLIRGTPLKKRY